MDNEEIQSALLKYWIFRKENTVTTTTVHPSFDDIVEDWEWRWADNKESIEIAEVNENKVLFNSLIDLTHQSSPKQIWLKFQIKKLETSELVLERQTNAEIYRVELKER
jgi:hypothetical protein